MNEEDSGLWNRSNSPKTTNGFSESNVPVQRSSSFETSSSFGSNVGSFKNGVIVRLNPSTKCRGSESQIGRKSNFESAMSDREFGVENEEYDCENEIAKVEKIVGENMRNRGKTGKGVKKRRRLSRRHVFGDRKTEKKYEDVFEPPTEINGENNSCETSNDHNLATVGGDGENNRRERLWCRQHELNSSSNEINRRDVTMSCDLTSNSVIKSGGGSGMDGNYDQNKNGRKHCPGNNLDSVSRSTCSDGSYLRRKHHKHHKHKQKSRSSVPTLEDSSSVCPKVNPIFLWVRQEDTRIVEVLCEDYDHRNRLRLTRTHLGWRAIPKTKTFAEVIIPQVKTAKEEDSEYSHKPKQTKRRKKMKKRKASRKTFISDNPNLIKECSVALCRDDLANYRNRTVMISNSEGKVSIGESIGQRPGSADSLSQPLKSNELHRDDSPPSPLSLSGELVDNFDGSSKKLNKLIKSNSCDFPSFVRLDGLPRSISLDLNLKKDIKDIKVQKGVMGTAERANSISESTDIVLDVKSEPDIEEVKEIETEKVEVSNGNESEEAINQRNHSESIIVDMTKHDSDFNDADCDELGQLLKDIPDLEFVEEEELEEVNEDEEWSTPTDLTLPKSKIETKTSEIKLTLLPPNISPLVTVTSSLKPSEPLTAPLPEVTITPVPNPKPAHQRKPQNNFLESLLSSSHSVKPERDEVNPGQKLERKPFDSCERKTLKHFHDINHESETKSKKLKMEDITLKNLLSKNQSGKTDKSLGLESCVQNLKMMEGEEFSKSRLQELLTDKVSLDPISQLKEVLSNPHLAVPDPLLVPRARLPALVASPASEIPRLLTMHLEKAVEETPCPPVTDSDVLEVSLSNLQSLLSCSPDKSRSANTQDFANYQKSLETFLEWQRYQTELMEAQIKSTKPLPSGFTSDMADVAAATAFSQMLWLPYLNQFDFNCNNRDIMTFMNAMLTNDYQANAGNLNAPPRINISQVPQPSPFLTPTSPMDIESHIKTLAMWQEAVMMQQSSQPSRACSKVSSSPPQQDLKRSAKVPNHIPNLPPSLKKHNQTSGGSNISPMSLRGDLIHNNHLGFEIYQDVPITSTEYSKKQNRQNYYQLSMENHQKQLQLQKQYKQEHQNQFHKMQRNYANYQTELYRQFKLNERKKSGPMSGSISVKPLANLIDKSNRVSENKSSWEMFEENSKNKADFTSRMASKLQQFNTQIHRTRVKEENSFDWQHQSLKQRSASSKPKSTEVRRNSKDTPKLKVKNLVDPNMSPPKLLKQIRPEHLPIVMDERKPMQDDGQAHLWHPLFGSNQIKTQPYNSPWQWTTVTVNGE